MCNGNCCCCNEICGGDCTKCPFQNVCNGCVSPQNVLDLVDPVLTTEQKIVLGI